MWQLETSPRPFLIFKEASVKRDLHEEVSILIWTNFDSFANTYLIQIVSFCNGGCA